MAAVGGVYLALPRELVIGPTWLLPTVIAVLLAPTIVTHRMGRHSFNHALGIVNNGIITVALIWFSQSVGCDLSIAQTGALATFYALVLNFDANECSRLLALVLAARRRRPERARQACGIR